MEKIVGYVTPYIPLVDLISGGVTIGAHVVHKAMFDLPDEEPQLSEEAKGTTAQEQCQSNQEEVLPKTE